MQLGRITGDMVWLEGAFREKTATSKTRSGCEPAESSSLSLAFQSRFRIRPSSGRSLTFRKRPVSKGAVKLADGSHLGHKNRLLNGENGSFEVQIAINVS